MENGKSRLQQAQEDVEEVKVIMLDNMSKADERSGRLGELENRADQLLEKSKAFQKTSTHVKKKKQWENMKLKVIVGSIAAVTIVVIIIVIVAVHMTGGSEEKSDTSSDVDGVI